MGKSILKIIIIIFISIILFAIGIPVISKIIGSGYEPLFIGVLFILLVVAVIFDQILKKKR